MVGTHEDVQMWFVDFLKALYNHIVTQNCDHLNLTDWNFTTVHYVFSVPTIWDGTAVVKIFEKIVEDAGFGKATDHFVELDLTEAEAAAVYTARSSKNQRLVSFVGEDEESAVGASTEGPSMEKGHILLVCDSGGGTTVYSPYEFLG